MIKKVLVVIVLLIIVYFTLIITVHNEKEPILFYMKTHSYKKAYEIANSMKLFDWYIYSKHANGILAEFYMFEIDNLVKQDFNKAEEYCLIAQKQCDIKWMYKEAVAYYCKNNLVEYPAYGYINKGEKKNYKQKCEYSQKRWKEIKELNDKAYKLPISYWLLRFD